MKIGSTSPFTGLTPSTPARRTPVFSLLSSVRSRSLFEAAFFWYAFTSSAFFIVPSASHFATSECSGESTMYVAPNSVSQRVV